MSPQVPEILLAISDERIAEMQGNIAKVWHRCAKSSAAVSVHLSCRLGSCCAAGTTHSLLNAVITHASDEHDFVARCRYLNHIVNVNVCEGHICMQVAVR